MNNVLTVKLAGGEDSMFKPLIRVCKILRFLSEEIVELIIFCSKISEILNYWEICAVSVQVKFTDVTEILGDL